MIVMMTVIIIVIMMIIMMIVIIMTRLGNCWPPLRCSSGAAVREIIWWEK